jgi:hypothetical protein
MTKYDQSYNPEANSQEKAIEGLQYAERMNPKPLVLLNHPSRKGKYSLAEIKAYDEAGTVAAGFEGAPGHQANPTRGSYPGTEPGSSRTYGGYDKMTAEVGGLWDTLLSEGRKWFITANSDFHKHYTENGGDFWPGEYSKTYVWAKEKSYAAVLDSLRNGRSYTVQGDLINALELTAEAQGKKSGLGETLFCSQGGDIKVTIKVRDPQTLNNHGDNPAVKQVQLISNAGGSPEITRVFTAANWQKQGDWLVMEHTFPKVARDFYVRARGSSTEETNPAEDPQNEDAWQDLWFYSNPIFINAGFMTGGGWIDSPEGAYPDNQALTGKVTFGFVSKYQKGATVPTGQTEFHFQVAGLNFHSSSYDWLVIAGARAQYKGTGTINGMGEYGFILTAIDGQISGGGLDKFRIKIWNKADNTIVYDNQLGASDTADPVTVLGGGSIVIHKK